MEETVSFLGWYGDNYSQIVDNMQTRGAQTKVVLFFVGQSICAYAGSGRNEVRRQENGGARESQVKIM